MHVRQRQEGTVESEDEGRESEGEEQDYQSDYDHNEVQYVETRSHARPSNEHHPTQPRPGHISRSGTINRQQSELVQPGTSNAIHPHHLHHPQGPAVRMNRIDPPYKQSTQHGGNPVGLRSCEAPPNSRNRFADSSTTHHPSHDFRFRPPLSDRHHSHSRVQSHARTHYGPPSNFARDARPRALVPSPPPDLPPPRQGTKRRNPEQSDDDGTQFRTGLRFHRINSRGQLIPRAEADSLLPRNSQATVPRQTYQRHPQHPDSSHASTNKRLRASTPQTRAAYSVPHDGQFNTSVLMPSTSHQLYTGGHRQPSRYPSFRSPGHYTQGHPVSAIEEEDAQMAEQPMYTGQADPDDYDSNYYHQEDDAYEGQDFCAEGDYFNDGYSGERR